MPSSSWAREKAEAVCADSVWTDELVERMAAALDEAESARLKWAIALQSLTPGGSEFQTPEACVETVRRRYAGDHERVLEFAKAKKAAEVRAQKLEHALRIAVWRAHEMGDEAVARGFREQNRAQFDAMTDDALAASPPSAPQPGEEG